MGDLVKKLQSRKLREGLSDVEVAKAILKVMQKSKQWKNHAKLHKDAELVILATPGLDTPFEQQDRENLPNLLLKIEQREAPREGVEALEKPDERQEIFVYGLRGESKVFSYSKGAGVVFSYQNPASGSFSYSKTQDDAMVVAGCPCGFMMKVAAANARASGEHTLRHNNLGLSFKYRANISDIYSPQNNGLAGYGSNSASVLYGGTSVSGYKPNVMEKEKGHGTGF